MHIVDGAVSLPVLLIGATLTAGGVALGLRRLEADRLPQVAMLSSAFFLASLVHIPLGPVSVHLVLNGLMGVLLGWSVFPALLVALLLQAVFFGFGGLLVLGVNTFNLALPAIVCFYLCSWGIRRSDNGFAWGAVAGSLAVLLSTLLVGLSLAVTGQAFVAAAKLVFVTNLPVALVEGLLTGAAVVLVRKVKPEAFQRPLGTPVQL